MRVLVNGSWCDKLVTVNNKSVKEFNPKSIDIRFQGLLDSKTLSATKLFTDGFLLGSELRAINESIGASNDNYSSDKLLIEDDKEYHIVAKATKNSTRKSKFRCQTFDNGEQVTFVSLQVPSERAPSVGVEVTI